MSETLDLAPVAAMATALAGQPVSVVWADLAAERCVGRAARSGAGWAIELDRSLGFERRAQFSFTALHEIAHVVLRHDAPSAAAEAAADAWAVRMAAAIGREACWRMAHGATAESTRQIVWRKVLALSAELKSERRAKQPPAGGHRAPASKTAAEAAAARRARSAPEELAYLRAEFGDERTDLALMDTLPEQLVRYWARTKRDAGEKLGSYERRLAAEREPVRWAMGGRVRVVQR